MRSAGSRIAQPHFKFAPSPCAQNSRFEQQFTPKQSSTLNFRVYRLS